jgi:hypothetical protein
MKETCASVALLLALGLASCGGLPGLPRTPALAPQPPTSAAGPTIGPVPTSAAPDLVPITVYFTDSARYAAGTPPFEAAVTRMISTTEDPAAAVLDEFFLGPTPEEQARGLERIASGFAGYRELEIEGGIAHIYLAGPCISHGATYTIAQPLMANLLQLPDIEYVKIYDEEGTTEVPDGPSNSIPFCLEP